MNNQEFIPKVIHYCWFGNKPLSTKAKKCIASWKKFCPDYKIIEWNETNFDINILKYTKQAYESKKYAFVSDYARFYIIYHHGGIYMDVDVEVIKNLDSFLTNKAFAGFETIDGVNPGLILASEKNNILVKEIMDSYINRVFITEEGTYNQETVVTYVTDILKKYGLNCNGKTQMVLDMKIYSISYFCPINYVTRKINITKDTYTIHFYNASWASPKYKIANKIIELIGYTRMKKLIAFKRFICSKFLYLSIKGSKK